VLFTLMGDANMYWSVAMSKLPGMKIVHARHEHCAVAMADGYARATGKVGVASTTCGPGFTQIMTALAIAARATCRWWCSRAIRRSPPHGTCNRSTWRR